MTEEHKRRSSDFILEVCDVKHEVIEGRIGTMERTLERIANRPPVWATLALTTMGAIIGGLASFVLSHFKLF